jgi:starch synthase
MDAARGSTRYPKNAQENMEKVLFATGEAHPLIKTGGLADVSGALPPALQSLQRDVRLILPAYRSVLAKAEGFEPAAELTLPGVKGGARLLQGELPGTRVPTYLVDIPAYYHRDGGPYGKPGAGDFADNAARFAALARAVVEVAMDRAGLAWHPDLVHCNDWQTGLAPALLSLEPSRPASVFTIHNLSYQGLFPAAQRTELGLPGALWGPAGLEYYGRLSFIKGGLVFADYVTTVSPTYAREIRTSALGYGLEGLLSSRSGRLMGILNGVDYGEWDPSRDRFLATHYGPDDLDGKAQAKADLQRRMGLPQRPQVPLMGLIGRLVEQKGFDLVLGALGRLPDRDLQVAVLGSGEPSLEAALKEAADRHPERVAAFIGYDEALAHRVEAGADLFLMPSRYEPCGLNQMYSLRYGTVPLVRRTGGLADSVVDADGEALAAGRATGFVFDAPTPDALADAVERALALYARPEAWRRLMLTGMAQDFSWSASAWEYVTLYRAARDARDAALAAAAAGTAPAAAPSV